MNEIERYRPTLESELSDQNNLIRNKNFTHVFEVESKSKEKERSFQVNKQGFFSTGGK